jgi:hypothetical protein
MPVETRIDPRDGRIGPLPPQRQAMEETTDGRVDLNGPAQRMRAPGSARWIVGGLLSADLMTYEPAEPQTVSLNRGSEETLSPGGFRDYFLVF